MNDTPTTLLVAERDENTRAFLLDNLAADGYEPLGAQTEQETRVKLRNHGPALAVLGRLEAERGPLMRAIRSGEASCDPSLPVIALGERGDEPELLRALEAGCDYFMSKPFSYVEAGTITTSNTSPGPRPPPSSPLPPPLRRGISTTRRWSSGGGCGVTTAAQSATATNLRSCARPGCSEPRRTSGPSRTCCVGSTMRSRRSSAASRPTRKPGYPRFEPRSRFDPLTWSFAGNAGGVGIADGRLRLQGVGHVKVRWHCSIPTEAAVKPVQVKRSGSRWYVCFLARRRSAQAAERHLAARLPVAVSAALGVVLAPGPDDLLDLLLHQLGQHAEPDADRQRHQPLLGGSGELAEGLLDARGQLAARALSVVAACATAVKFYELRDNLHWDVGSGCGVRRVHRQGEGRTRGATLGC